MLLSIHSQAKIVAAENQIRRDEDIVLATRFIDLASELGLSPAQTERIVFMFLNRSDELEE